MFRHKQFKCRHCGEPFSLYPGKPGFIDQCIDCLSKKPIAFKPRGLTQSNAKQANRFERIRDTIRGLLTGYFGASPEEAERFIQRHCSDPKPSGSERLAPATR